jgi:2-amino-4-hydroxy-6-hydroxymethyldihydropteridine diphosphokinase
VSTVAYLSLGSNLGDRAANLHKAIARLGQVAIVLRVSSFYETEPMEFRDQPWFLNCAVELQTDKTARELLGDIQLIEHELGRNRAVQKGPRTLDIDLLLFGKEMIDSADLMVPHPAMHERRFVLAPLAELSSELRHPLLGRTARELLADLGTAGGEVRRIK